MVRLLGAGHSLTNEEAALTLYHEFHHHVTYGVIDIREQELSARVATEEFAIAARLPPTKPTYRTGENTVGVEAIKTDLCEGPLAQHYNSQVRWFPREYFGEEYVSF